MLPRVRQLQQLLQGTLGFSERSNQTLAYQLECRAARTPERDFLRFEEERYSYAEANACINRHAHAYRSLGIARGDVVALLMENRPELLWHVFALHKLGAVAAMINSQLADQPLAQAVRSAEPRLLVAGAELGAPVARVAPLLGELWPEAILWDGGRRAAVQQPAPDGTRRFSATAADVPSTNPPESSRQPLSELAAYIYTSGTTGLPKPALIRHERLYRAGKMWSSLALGLREDDVLYNCLPLYHSNALMLATGSVVSAGATMALARKFSRTRFWDDVRRHEATAFIYIGELCRYLVHAPPDARDRDHRVRVITGNGLQRDVWKVMRERFGIRRVCEFYGATESNCITLNVFNVLGSVGPKLPTMALARWDDQTQDFVRDASGFLVKAKSGESGILLGRITGPRTRFDGYRDPEATQRKVVRDAFAPGDAYFNSGDLLRVDHLRHLYFVDRVGDTFRWKGENVSTTEVQQQIASWPPAFQVAVYGVQVPGAEGRAGMLALALREGHAFDAADFQAHVDARLAPYARPLFVRLVPAIELTGTFKIRTAALQKEGFDPTATSDPMYFRHPERDAYVPLDAALHAEIGAERLRL